MLPNIGTTTLRSSVQEVAMLSDDDIQAQVLAVFRAEQAEHRQTITEILLDLERNPDHPHRRELIDGLFRAAHSLKGGARAAGVNSVEQIAHQIEHIFAALRQNQLSLTADVCDVIYQALDVIGVLMEQAVPGQMSDQKTLNDLLAHLISIGQGTNDGGAVSSSPPATSEPIMRPSTVPFTNETSIRIDVAILDSLMSEMGELLTSTLRARQLARDLHELVQIPERWQRTWRRTAPVLRQRSSDTDRAVMPRNQLIVAETLKQADEVISVLSKKLAQLAYQARDHYDRLAEISTRMQAQIQRTRMSPLSRIIGSLRLHVRDLARSAGKEVEFVVEDAGAEADRQVLDQVYEICLHLLRNAIDHGIERPDVRKAKGKMPVGLIRLIAGVSGDRLSLVISDDGVGIDREGIKQRALQMGLLSKRDIEHADDAVLFDLLFTPGFSTKSKVSELSGRGVGLDVVRTTVERMGGSVTVTSVPDQGTTFTLTLPLTLMRSHGLLISVHSQLFALPVDNLRRVVQVNRSQIHILEGRPVLLVDSRPVQLISLARLIGYTSDTAIDLVTPKPALLIGSNERQIACLVDDIGEEIDLVVHRLPAPLKRVRFISGAAILADGSVAPILDAVDLLRAALMADYAVSLPAGNTTPSHPPTILVVDDSITTRTLEKNILEAAGYRVVLATDGQEALERLHHLQDQGGCQLVLSDIDMPRLNGFDLTRQIRTDPAFRHLPIVLVTSLDSQADRERGLAAGADAYIVKRAFDQQVLLETIARLL